MKTRFLSLLFFVCFVAFAGTSYAQTDCRTDPSDCTLVSRAVMQKALEDSDTVKAQEAEIKGLKQAIEDFRKALNDMRVEFARVSGENSALKQNAVSDRAIIDVLLKHVKPKKVGLINF